MKEDIHPAQIRAARALVGWTRDDLAAAAKTTARTLARLEAGETEARASTARTIRTALEGAGVEFIAENGGGPGVRLRARTAAVATLPKFTVHEVKAGGGYYVLAKWPNGREKQIYDFGDEESAQRWIESDAPTWAARHPHSKDG